MIQVEFPARPIGINDPTVRGRLARPPPPTGGPRNDDRPTRSGGDRTMTERPRSPARRAARWCAVVCAALAAATAATRPARAACKCGKTWPHLICAQQAYAHQTGPGDV